MWLANTLGPANRFSNSCSKNNKGRADLDRLLKLP
jgi:hypothetical protein